MKSMAWHCGLCDKLYKNVSPKRIPKWMDSDEEKDWIIGWKYANSLIHR